VDPSISVKSNVIVPAGKSRILNLLVSLKECIVALTDITLRV
jgi:hypothetical protein